MKRDVKPGLQPSSDPRPKAAGGPRRIVGRGITNGWATAVALVERWLAANERVDSLLEQLTPDLPAQERARAQHLFYGVVRWASRLDSALAGLMSRPPRTKVRAVLMVAGFELIEQGAGTTGLPDGAAAKVIHHAVEQAKTVASAKEAGLINAVARKMAVRLAEEPKTLADRWSHPAWLVARWTRQFGAEPTAKLLEWNQTPAPVYARWRKSSAETVPEFLAPTKWSGFFEVKAGHWDEVRKLANDGAIYLQDPSTRLCVELLAPQANETILDACAAPGGKSLMIADAMQTGRVVALDEEGPRLVRLRENLNRAPSGVTVALMPGDLTTAGAHFFADFNLPDTFDAVLLDAPCSNTGVMRHRIDVKWRLQEGDIPKHAKQQVALLHAAARLVRPGGRLVYSTCSIEAEENEKVIKAFFDSRAGGPFKLERQILAHPWADGHDGAGAFLLRKQ